MTTDVFVDTSAWYALADRADAHHAEAVHVLHALSSTQRGLTTTNFVVAETYTLIRTRLGGDEAARFLRAARESAFVRREQVPETWQMAAEELLLQYGDQDFSYVDATSFIAMRQLGIIEAFAFDRHFAKAGFIGTVVDQGE